MSFISTLLKEKAPQSELHTQIMAFEAHAPEVAMTAKHAGTIMATENFSIGAAADKQKAISDYVSGAVSRLHASLQGQLPGKTGVNIAIENWRTDGNEIKSVPSNQGYTPSILSAVLGGALASAALHKADPAFSGRKVSMESMKADASASSFGVAVMADASGFATVSPEIVMAREAFNNGQLDESKYLAYAQAYNFFAVGQDEAVESIYPSIILSPDQAGVSVEATVMAIWDGVKHTSATTSNDFKKRMLVRARRNPKLLARDATNVVPHFTPQQAAHFVDVAKFPKTSEFIDKLEVETNFLLPGAERNLLLLSNHPTLLGNAVMNEKDSLEPAVLLKSVGLYLGDVAFAFSTRNIPGNQFSQAQQGMQPQRVLNINIESFTITKDTTDVAGQALPTAWTDALKDNTLVLGMSISGSVNVESSFIQVGAVNNPYIVSLVSKTGELISSTHADYLAVKALLAGFNNQTDFGFKVEAFRSNLTFRQAGQLVDRMKFTQLYEVALRAPVSAQCPVSQKDTASPELLTTMLATLRSRISGELVTNLLAHLAAVEECAKTPLKLGDIPVHLGAGRFSLLPYHDKGQIDLSDTLSLSESDRRQDISSRIVNFLKDRVYNCYQKSEYQAAAEQKYGGIAPRPTVVILTDVVTASYITIPGDTRTMGDQFDFRVVTTLDSRMDNKIAVVFNYLDGTQNANVNELNFGNLLWSAENLYQADLTIDGQHFHRMTSQPRYRFINHAPVGMLFDVVGIKQALDNRYLVDSL